MAKAPFLIAAVPYLYARPLLSGLEERGDVELLFAPPADLPGLLQRGEADAALVSTIDVQKAETPWTVLPAGGVSCRGRTLTTRVYARIPPEEMRTLWVDGESHTSVALARLLWRKSFGRKLKCIPYDPQKITPPESAEAVLLIGDRVVVDPPLGFHEQIDLGALWFEMTGLPFVFGLWAARESAHAPELQELLLKARRRGEGRLEAIAAEFGPPAGWPADLAERLLTKYMDYSFAEEHEDSLEEFFSLALEAELIPERRELKVLRA